MNSEQAQRLIHARDKVAQYPQRFIMNDYVIPGDSVEEVPSVVTDIDEDGRCKFCICGALIIQNGGVEWHTEYYLPRQSVYSVPYYMRLGQNLLGMGLEDAETLFIFNRWTMLVPELQDKPPTAENAVILINAMLRKYGYTPEGNRLKEEVVES